jgi:hypothetical protein
MSRKLILRTEMIKCRTSKIWSSDLVRNIFNIGAKIRILAAIPAPTPRNTRSNHYNLSMGDFTATVRKLTEYF